MQHELAENFMSSKDSSDVQVTESQARVCKHSLHTQREVYDWRRQQERMKHALHYFHQSAVTATVDDIPSIPHNADNADSSSKEHGLPTPQEISCFFLPIHDLDLSIFLLGKSFKIHFTWSDVLLGVATKKKKASQSSILGWQYGREEKVPSLIYPLDITYNQDEGSYELRSAKKEIYQKAR